MAHLVLFILGKLSVDFFSGDDKLTCRLLELPRVKLTDHLFRKNKMHDIWLYCPHNFTFQINRIG